MSHAILSPSAAHRWLKCPPSARLELKFPDTVSPAALEGTYAHKYAEIRLRYFNNEMNKEEYKKKIMEMKEQKYYSRELEENVDVYVEIVEEKYAKAKEKDKGAALLLEQKVDLSGYVREGYGHADTVIIADGTMEVVDLKYGAGVVVKAEGNPQIRLYGLGAYSELSYLYEIERVRLTIVQPRKGGISSETLTAKEMLKWGNEIKEIAELAYEGKGEYRAGEHCKFCRAANECRHHAEYELKEVKKEFDDPDLLTDDEIAEIVLKADSVIKWLGNVKEYALKEAIEKNKKWKWLKLVEGRSVRKITDEEKAAEILRAKGGAEEEIWKPREIFGLTALEKTFGKKKITEWLSVVIEKPPGSPTLVPETDKRAEWRKAENEFNDLDEEKAIEIVAEGIKAGTASTYTYVPEYEKYKREKKEK